MKMKLIGFEHIVAKKDGAHYCKCYVAKVAERRNGYGYLPIEVWLRGDFTEKLTELLDQSVAVVYGLSDFGKPTAVDIVASVE